MKSAVFFLLALFSVALSAELTNNALGPLRLCQCYLNNAEQLNIQPSSLSAKSLGPAQICHCMPSAKADNYPIGATAPASVIKPMTAPASVAMPMTGPTVKTPYRAPMSRSILGSLFGSGSVAAKACPIGHTIDGKYTVDDTAKLFMCEQKLSDGSYNQLTNINLVNSHYACDDFFFELKNVDLSSGLALGITVYGQKYAAIAKGSPPLPAGVKPLYTYAQWGFGSCVGVNPTSPAVYVSTLVGTNDAFKSMADYYGAYPVGVENGNVYPGGLQCVRIQNPFCV